MILSKFQERLSELMFDGGFTATTLGEKIGTGRVTVNRYLSGARYPTVEYLIKIADCFECTTDYLLGLTDENEKRVFSSPAAVGERFIDLCKRFGKTRYEVQKATGISSSCIYSWQKSPYFPSLDNILRLSDFFGCSVDHVIGRTRD